MQGGVGAPADGQPGGRPLHWCRIQTLHWRVLAKPPLAGFGSDDLPEIVRKAWLQLPELTQSPGSALSQI